MNILKYCLLIALSLTGALRAESTAVVPPPVPADPLAEVLPVLETKFPDFATLNYKPGDHLTDLIARSNGKLALTTPPLLSTAMILKAPVTLPDNVLYWRLATFSPEKTWLEIGSSLQQIAPATTGVILDLRSNLTPDDYRGAAQVLGFFAPDDITHFRLSSGATDPAKAPFRLAPGQFSFHVPIVVLVNNQTNGAAEALASCLKADGAIVIGRATAGRIGVFEEQKLNSGQVLRYYISSVGSEADASSLFHVPQHPLLWSQPVTPDIALSVNDRAEKAALVLIRDNRINDVIGESAERHRLSEASLVRGQDPELDDYLASLEKGPVLLSLPVIHDNVLISALDSLRAIRLSEAPSSPATTTAKASTPATTSSVQ